MRSSLGAFLVVMTTACGGAGSPESVPYTLAVYASLGTRQCETGGTSLDALRQRLVGAGLRVVESACGSDGRVYPAVCGAPDGRIAIFDIATSASLPALPAGFAALTTLPDASRRPCP